MRKTWAAILIAAAVGITPSHTKAAIQLTDNIDLTTDPNPAGGFSDGTGIWFNPLTGYVEQRGYFFPTTLYEDGKFFLVMDTYNQAPLTEANVLIQGFISRGNNILDDAFLNPLQFGDGASVGPGAGFTYSGGGYSDLGPVYGNWGAGEHGYLGLTIGDGTGTGSSQVFYGYAEITVNPDFSITLHSFAYNDVRGQAITTVSTVPEPSTLALASVALGAMTLFRRRQA